MMHQIGRIFDDFQKKKAEKSMYTDDLRYNNIIDLAFFDMGQ